MQNEENIRQQTIRNIFSHDFVFGFFGLFSFILAYHALIPTLPIFFEKSGSSSAEIGILVGVFGISSLIFRLVVGGALLKYSEKNIMMFGAALFVATFIVSLVLRPFWPFFAVRFFQGVAFACIDTAALAFIVKVTPLQNRTRAIGYFVLAPPFSQAIAPSFGMFLINHYSFTALFITCLVLALCSFSFSFGLKGQKMITPDQSVPPRGKLFFERKVIVPSISGFMQNFIWGAILAFFPLYAIQCGIKNPGYFFTANATMLIAGRVFGGKIVDLYNKEKILLIFIATSILALVILSLSKTLPMFILVGLIWGTGGSFFFPVSMTYSFEYAGSADGTTVGTFRALTDLGIALGPVIMGIFIPFTGYRGMFLCLAFLALINLLYFQFYVRKRGRRQSRLRLP